MIGLDTWRDEVLVGRTQRGRWVVRSFVDLLRGLGCLYNSLNDMKRPRAGI